MKKFKSIDCAIQSVLIVLGFILGASSADNMLDDYFFFLGYFLVGGWQLISVIVHFTYEAPYKKTMRKIYLITLGIVLLAFLFSIPTGDGVMMMLFVLLFFSPIMAVYYLITCINETQKLSEIMALQQVKPEQPVN
jgi:hypothetical protein